MPHRKRITFTQGQEILEHAIEYLEAVSDCLADLARRGLPERERMLLDAFASEHAKLTEALARYLEDAPPAALGTFSQFNCELPAAPSPPPEEISTLSLTQWLIAANQELVNACESIAANAASEEQRQAFEALSELVRTHDRTLSKEYQRFEDL